MIQSQLKSGFQSIFDTNYAGQAFPKTKEEAIKVWKSIFETYYKTMTLPISGSANSFLQVGLSLFESNLSSMIDGNTVNLAKLVSDLHTQIILGVTSTGLWTTKAPSVALNLDSSFLQSSKFEGTAESVCTAISTKIDTWIHTTVSVNNITKVVVTWV